MKSLIRYLTDKKHFRLLKLFAFSPALKKRAINRLMLKGYIDAAVSMNPEDENIRKKLEFMTEVRQKGLSLKKKPFKEIEKIKPLFLVHSSLPYDRAGYSIRTHMIAKFLQKKIPLGVMTRLGYPWDLQKHSHHPPVSEEIIDGVKYIRLFKNSFYKNVSDYEYAKEYASKIEETVKKEAFTVLHANSNYINAFSAFLASKKLKLPFIYEVRGFWHITRTTLDEYYKKGGMYEYEEEMERFALMKADRVVTISETLKNKIVSLGVDESKIRVISNGVDTQRFKPVPKNMEILKKYRLENKFVVGYIGTLSPYEGLDDVIKAVEGLENTVFLVVGGGREEERLKKLAGENVIFTGEIEYSDVCRYYSVMDVCVYFRKNYEVCNIVPPLKIFEAMAMKKGIIVSDVEALREIADKRALIVKSGDVFSLKEAIKKLKTDKNLYNKLTNNAYEWVLGKSWENIASEYVGLYEGLKGEKGENSTDFR